MEWERRQRLCEMARRRRKETLPLLGAAMDKDGGKTVDKVELCAAPAATVRRQPFLSGTAGQRPDASVGSRWGKLGQWAGSVSDCWLGPV
jgi:hypothetical protein